MMYFVKLLLGLVVVFLVAIWEQTDGFGMLTYEAKLIEEESTQQPQPQAQPEPNKNFAYATLLYSDNFVLGVLVLGESLEEVKSAYPKICIVSPQVGKNVRKLLEAKRWQVLEVDAIRNPHAHERHFQPRLLWAFTKMNIFNLPYDKVAYLDADMLVTSNIDHVFMCGSFCAVMRDNHFNTGFMVVSPNHDLFNQMLHDYASTPSYNAGEQGFTNSVFSDMLLMPMFDTPDSQHSVVVERANPNITHTRLPNLFNGDEAMFYMRDSHWANELQPNVIHYTMVIFKPWVWYEYFVLSLNQKWLVHNPMATEPAFNTLLRAISALTCFFGGLVVIRNGLALIAGNPLVVHYAMIVQTYSWQYALICSLFTFAMLVYVLKSCAFHIPAVPALHPVVAHLLFLEWAVVVLALFVLAHARFHLTLGVASPSNLKRKPDPTTIGIPAITIIRPFFPFIICAFVCCCELMLTRRGVVLLVRVIVEAVFMLLTLLLACYRLPFVAFNIGRAHVSTIRQ